MKDSFLIIKDFKQGWQKRTDPTAIPIGAAQESTNITLTDRGGISPMDGTLLIGEAGSGSGIKSLYSFKKTYGSDILIKTYDDRIEYFNNLSESWCLLKEGYQTQSDGTGYVFGFREHTTSADSLDWIYFGNSVDPYSRWCGYESKLNGALTGGETTITVDSTLLDSVFWSGTAVSSTATTITVPAGTWATDIWNDFYVLITSGVNSGKVALISATTATQITFANTVGTTGAITFEIRRLAVPASGTLVYNDQTVAYSAVPTSTTFTVASAVAASNGAGISVVPQEYPNDPRGNILETNIAQMFVSGVPSAGTTVYRSSLTDASDFTFSSPRSADEGDIIYFPYFGHKISDIKSQENVLYVIKRDSVEGLTYTQDNNDIAQIDTILQGVNVGTEARAWRMENDIAFVTPDKRITTIGRLKLQDQRPQMVDIADSIHRAMDNFGVDSVYGEEYRDRAFICLKSTPEVAQNDVMLVRNKTYNSWEGIWQLAANAVVAHNGNIYYGNSYSPDVYQMQVGLNKVKGGDTFPMGCSWWSGYINKEGAGFYLNEVSSIAVEGYITSGTTININLFKDFAELPFQNLAISGLDNAIQDGQPSFTFLGGDPLGLEPLGASSIVGDPDPSGRRHFIAILYFPITQVEYIAVEVASNGLAQSWEVIKLGINTTSLAFENQNRILP